MPLHTYILTFNIQQVLKSVKDIRSAPPLFLAPTCAKQAFVPTAAQLIFCWGWGYPLISCQALIRLDRQMAAARSTWPPCLPSRPCWWSRPECCSGIRPEPYWWVPHDRPLLQTRQSGCIPSCPHRGCRPGAGNLPPPSHQRAPEKGRCCQTEWQNICQKACQTECQKECQKICQKECQKECQKICQNICRKTVTRYVRKTVRRYVRNKICQKECQKICQTKCQKECQAICQKEWQNVRRYVRKNVRKMSERMWQDMSEDMSERMSEDMSERIAERMFAGMSEEMSEIMSPDMSERMSDKM